MNFHTEIQKTKQFKSLNSVQRELTLTKTNRGVIERGYNVAKTIGFESCEKMSGYSDRNKTIIKQMLPKPVVEMISVKFEQISA